MFAVVFIIGKTIISDPSRAGSNRNGFDLLGPTIAEIENAVYK